METYGKKLGGKIKEKCKGFDESAFKKWVVSEKEHIQETIESASQMLEMIDLIGIKFRNSLHTNLEVLQKNQEIEEHIKWCKELFVQNHCHYSQATFDDIKEKIKANTKDNLLVVLKVLEEQFNKVKQLK